MSKMHRDKGARGELKLIKRIEELTGIKLKRNASIQAGERGNSDLIDLNGRSPFKDWSLECKNVEDIAVSQWWRQTLTQAEKAGKRPLLMYHVPRTKRWVAVMRVVEFTPGGAFYFGTPGNPYVYEDAEAHVSMELEAFTMLLKMVEGKAA